MRVVLFSGGMDSLAAWKLHAPDAARVYVRIGAPYEEREMRSIAKRGLDVNLRIVTASRTLGSCADAAGRVQLRNLLFAVAAAAEFDTCDEVVLGALAGETSPDKSRRFAAAASAAMTASEGRRIRLALPFRGLTKTELVARYLEARGRTHGERELRECPSCYVAEFPACYAGCGRCTSCLRRWVAFSLNGIDETYETPPWTGDWLSRDRASWAKYVTRTPPRDWSGVLRANMELMRAMRRAGAL